MTARKSFPSEICLLNIITIFERCHIAILLTFPAKNIIASKFLLIACVLSGKIAALVIRRQQKKFNSRSLRPGNKARGLTVENKFIGYNFGIDMALNQNYQNLAHIKNSSPLTFQSINIVLISHVICHVTILLKMVNY